MNFLNDLVDEIKQKHPNEIYVSELSGYFSRYRKYYDENVKLNPRQGFVDCWSWDDERRKEFNEKIDEQKIKVIDDTIKPLHKYELKQKGLLRLKELRQKIISI